MYMSGIKGGETGNMEVNFGCLLYNLQATGYQLAGYLATYRLGCSLKTWWPVTVAHLRCPIFVYSLPTQRPVLRP